MHFMERMRSWSFWAQNHPHRHSDIELHTEHLLASLLLMAWFVEARDPYTGGHLWRVSRYARLLAERAGFDDAQSALISLGGFLHDLGKVGIPDAILKKPSRLTVDEYEVMKTHPEIGLRMLAGHPLSDWVRDVIWLHHERPDGKGYPKQLSGEQIPEAARLVGICDAFDAMTSHRPYRAGMSRDQALAIIEQEIGVQFDSVLAVHFLELGKAGLLDAVIGHSDEGIPLRVCPMCGPTLVIQRHQQANQYIYCPNCSGEFFLKESDTGLEAVVTGRQGKPENLTPNPDVQLIARTVSYVIRALPIADILRASQAKKG